MTAITSTAFAGRTRRRSVQRRSEQAQRQPSVQHSVQPPTRLHITRRGRLVVAVLLAAPLIVVAALFGPGALDAVAGTQTSGAQFQHVTVVSGQSLWQIAESIAPNDDPRDVVSDIADLNGLTGSVVVPGQRLAIPQQYTSGQ